MVAGSGSSSKKSLVHQQNGTARRSSVGGDQALVAGPRAPWDNLNNAFSASFTQRTASLFASPGPSAPITVGAGGSSILREIRAGGYKESWGENPELRGEDPREAGEADEVPPPPPISLSLSLCTCPPPRCVAPLTPGGRGWQREHAVEESHPPPAFASTRTPLAGPDARGSPVLTASNPFWRSSVDTCSTGGRGRTSIPMEGQRACGRLAQCQATQIETSFQGTGGKLSKAPVPVAQEAAPSGIDAPLRAPS